MRRPTWPEARAALLAFHVLSVAVMSLPGATLTSTKGLESRTVQADIDDWARGLGMRGKDLQATVRSVGQTLIAARRVLAPFDLYGRITGSSQGWTMFATPQRHPSEMHVEGRVADEGWKLLYRPHDPAATFMEDFMRHNRVRKFTGRFARAARNSNYEGLAAYLARRACQDDRDLIEVRVALWSYPALDRAAAARGERPNGTYERQKTHPCAATP